MESKRSKGGSLVGGLLSLVVLVGLLLTLPDVFQQDPAVIERAHAIACAAPSGSAASTKPAACGLQMRQWLSNVLYRQIDFEAGTRRVRVRCMREYVAVGEYRCEVE